MVWRQGLLALAIAVPMGVLGGLIDTMKHDIFVVTEKTFDGVIVSHRKVGVAAVVYYDNDEKSKSFIDGEYNLVSTELRGMAKVAGLDCTEWEAFCKAQGVTQFPTVVIYPPHPFNSLVYDGELKQKPLVSAITRHIPGDHIKMFPTSESEAKSAIEKFLTTNISVPKVLLFSEKPNPPILFKALANSFNDRMSFGFVKSDATEIVNRLKIKEFPSLVVVTGIISADNVGETYDGELNFAALHEWLNIRSETFVKGGGYSSHDNAEEEKPWLVQDIPEITRASNQDVCFRHDALCVIYISKSGEPSSDVMEYLKDLSNEYKAQSTQRTAKFIFSWLDASIEKSFIETVGLGENLPSVVIFNPHRRLRYIKLPEGVEPSQTEIGTLIEKILGGDARFTNVKGQKIPAFAARPTTQKAASDEL